MNYFFMTSNAIKDALQGCKIETMIVETALVKEQNKLNILIDNGAHF